MSVERLFEITNILLVEKSVTAKYLAEYFEVSTRTIYRDIEKLSLAKIPIYTNRGNKGGIFLLDHFKLNKSLLTNEEQSSILNSIQASSYNIDEKTKLKLKALFNYNEKEWLSVQSQLGHSRDFNDYVEIIKNAIFSELSIKFDYSSAKKESTSRIIYPYKIILAGNQWYLSAYCTLRKQMRLFKLSRIKNLEMHKEFDYTIFKQFNEIELFKNESELKLEKTVLKFAKENAYLVYDEFDNDCIVEKDNYLIVTIYAPHDIFFIRYLANLLDDVEILEPKSLITKVIEVLNKVINKYQI